MIVTKLYEYDAEKEEQGYRGTDYSAHILLGDVVTDDLTEVLGTAELTLGGLPRSEEFAPKTKFILDKIDDSNIVNDMPYTETWHLVVQEDVVSKPILSDDNYYDHHITLIEASALAQGYLVDNIATTYKLQDVTLDGETVIDPDKDAVVNFVDAETPISGGHFGGFYVNRVSGNDTEQETNIGRRFRWDSGVKTAWDSLKYYQATPVDGSQRTITIPIPMLEVAEGKTNGTSTTFQHCGYCSIKTVVTRTSISAGSVPEVIQEIITNPCRNDPGEAWKYAWNTPSSQDYEGKILSSVDYYISAAYPYIANTKKYARVAEYVDTVQNREITLELEPNYIYNINSYLVNNVSYYSHSWVKYILAYVNIKNETPTGVTNNEYPYVSLEFSTYLEGSDVRVQLQSAPERNAYELFQKAQITTRTTYRNNNYYTGGSITDEPLTFYLEDSDKLELKNTQVVENFYNQKNFWEILVEIGKYIHAIPKIEFGVDNRFVVKWQRLGLTEEFDDASTKISIFNSRSVENYICACSSYVKNIVQLGGVIDEWVAPKSSSEDYLVYNDVAEIKTGKPIIEIVEMEVKHVSGNYDITIPGDTKTLTPKTNISYEVDPEVNSATIGLYYIKQGSAYIGIYLNGENYDSGTDYYKQVINNGYVFEENVYNVLDVNYITRVNKGFAIYYELGTNIIKGLNYRLPTVSGGDYQGNYAIKNIIGRVFGIGNNASGENPSAWADIKVNDFIFHIIYRTKDSARVEQSRPDLRKYIVNSKYDNDVPQHKQFNNQTDVVLDSNAFGNNIYGKLIRTGNSNYTTTEWVDSLANTKKVGQLYSIRGDKYYVSTVKNTTYGTHIISEVTFTKDYNQLSEIIGIPSEPRFYEISEQSLIEREVVINDYIYLSTEDYGSYWLFTDFYLDLLFGRANAFPKYAITIFKNDIDNPINDVPGNNSFYKEVMHPINTYSLQNTLTMEWDMADNFSAGDKVTPTAFSTNTSNNLTTTDTSYSTLTPVQYTDVYGRADLFDVVIMKDVDGMTAEDIRNLPECPLATRDDGSGRPSITTNGDNIVYSTEPVLEGEPIGIGLNTVGVGLLKDSREKISINVNSQMITASDRFVLSSWLWQVGKGNLKLALLKNEINKLSNDTISETDIISDEYIIYKKGTGGQEDIFNVGYHYPYLPTAIQVPISTLLRGADLTDVKAIAIVSELSTKPNSGARYFVMGRNITGLDTADVQNPNKDSARADWFMERQRASESIVIPPLDPDYPQ